MEIRHLHRWDVTPAEARAIQAELRPRLIVTDTLDLAAVRHVAGVDNGYVTVADVPTAFAAVCVFTFPELTPVETRIGQQPVTFPYVPGLLTFREAPAVLAACAALSVRPDLFLFDGQGYAHPRRLGLASHLGLVLDTPSVGCAKSRLIGHFQEPDEAFGDHTPLIDHDEVIGSAVRTRPGHTPLLVSPGHKISVPDAVAAALACCRDLGFLPVPTQAAHDAVGAATWPYRKHRGATPSAQRG